MKRILSILLTLTMLAMPFLGVFPASMMASAVVSTTAPAITVNIEHWQTVSPLQTITVNVTAQNGSTLTSCNTRLEGTSIGTGATVSFTPASKSLSDGVYTLVVEATDSAGNTSFLPLTFYVDSKLDANYAVDMYGTVTSDGSVTMHEATVLPFSAGYGTSKDGNIDLSALTTHNPSAKYHLTYTDNAVEVSSVSGIPYQVFDVDLQGKTSGNVVVSYAGTTKNGERLALKAYNPATASWTTVDTVVGGGNMSATLDAATYNDGGKIHVAAVLDYATNGANSMIWSTDPQHYTKFEDLHEYYYEIYRYAAKEYQSGNVGYIMTTGDLVDDRPQAAVSTKQWGVADKAMSFVEAVGMPNGLVSGNHDVCDYKLPDYSTGENTNDYSKYWATFPSTRYNNKNFYGGSINNNMSHYDLVTIGNVDFIVMYLGYGREATDEAIAWANQVLKTYSHRTAIIATHEYLDATIAQRAGRGELIYSKIVDPNPNVKMVLCGHDDGALCLEKTASDGRTVYELLADYQFVEAEDPDFYANEHWIGSVPSCCGDGYIRIMTVEGDSLSSITYSPVTGRYNPYGDRESFTIDLNSGTPDRKFSTSRFSAVVVGNTTTSTNVDRIGVITKNGHTSYTTVIHRFTPSAPFDGNSTDYGNPATTPGTAYDHVAVTAPTVSQKVDLLSACGLTNDTTVSAHATFAMGGKTIDLTKTPYLYYSFEVPTDSEFTFAFISDTTNAPWLTFLDATKGGGTMSAGAGVWDTYTERQQYFNNSATGCIDMRTLLTNSSATSWIIREFRFYHYYGDPVTVNYMFFGDAATTVSWPNTTFGPAATTYSGAFEHAAELPPAVAQKVDVLSAVGLSDKTTVTGYKTYSASSLKIDLTKTPYLYYSFALTPGEKFTFGFINNATTVPWLTFLDATKGGNAINYGAATWDTQAGAQYFTTSMTGCIDMRRYVTSATATSWTLQELRFYPSSAVPAVMSYLFFGSESTDAMKDYGTPNDYAALQALIAKANATSTTGYTTASVNEFNAAKTAAASVSTASEDAVKAAYIRLEQAMGALTKVKSSIAASSLVSVKNYSLSASNWKCSSTGTVITGSTSWLKATQTNDGMILNHTSNATHMWPSIYNEDSFTVYPNGEMYLNLDVDAANNWMIEMTVTQAGKTDIVRPNMTIEHAFHSRDTHGFEGEFVGVYNISDAFCEFGFDPYATFTVSKMRFYVMGDDTRCTATVNHLELMTDPKPASVDRRALYAAINNANDRTKSMYTSSSWSAMQTALSAANTAASDTSLSSAAVNLAAYKLRVATDNLVYASVNQPAGSLLPDDLAQLVRIDASLMNIWRDSNITYLQNNNDQWPSATYTFDDERYVTVRDHQIEVDMTVGDKTNVQLLIDGEWISISKYIGVADNAGDLAAGDYRIEIPLSSIDECKNKVAVTIGGTRLYSIGESANSTVAVSRLLIEDYDNYVWDTGITYGHAATPTNPYYAHAAKNGPTVTHKVDVLAAAGLEAHPNVSGMQTYGDNIMHLSVDMNKTPYLYYSAVVPAGANFTFAMYNNTTNAPWLIYLDAAKGGAQMTAGADAWNAAGGTQYATTSVTGCIDMRNYMTSTDSMTWIVNTLSLYCSKGDHATVSYLYFGSAPIDDGYVEETYKPGDVNDDGKVSTVDARMILFYVLGVNRDFTATQIQAADYDRNGSLSTSDIRMMLQALANGLA